MKNKLIRSIAFEVESNTEQQENFCFIFESEKKLRGKYERKFLFCDNSKQR